MATIRRSAEVQTAPVGERVVLFHRSTGRSIVLNPSAALLWSALELPKTAVELAGLLCRLHVGLAADRAAADVDVCVKQFIAESLVTIDD